MPDREARRIHGLAETGGHRRGALVGGAGSGRAQLRGLPAAAAGRAPAAPGSPRGDVPPADRPAPDLARQRSFSHPAHRVALHAPVLRGRFQPRGSGSSGMSSTGETTATSSPRPGPRGRSPSPRQRTLRLPGSDVQRTGQRRRAASFTQKIFANGARGGARRWAQDHLHPGGGLDQDGVGVARRRRLVVHAPAGDEQAVVGQGGDVGAIRGPRPGRGRRGRGPCSPRCQRQRQRPAGTDVVPSGRHRPDETTPSYGVTVIRFSFFGSTSMSMSLYSTMVAPARWICMPMGPSLRTFRRVSM